MLLHGEQFLEMRAPIPLSGTLTSHAQVSHLYDKGSGALLILDVTSRDESGRDIFFNRYSLFIRGLGNFGGDKGPKDSDNADSTPPQSPPHIIHLEQTKQNQALIYRLAGDTNPLHADPSMAAIGGFDRPILHGLCSFGFALRAVLKHFANNDTTKFKSIKARFAKHVFPGETLITEMWLKSPTTVVFRMKVAERGDYVLTNGIVELHSTTGVATATGTQPEQAPTSAKPATDGSTFQCSAVFDELKTRLNAGLVKQVSSTFRFDVNSNGKQRIWLVDLKQGSGNIRELSIGDTTTADCVITIGDTDLVALMGGKLNPQAAFMQKKLTLKGNVMLAQKLSLLFSSRSKL